MPAIDQRLLHPQRAVAVSGDDHGGDEADPDDEGAAQRHRPDATLGWGEDERTGQYRAQPELRDEGDCILPASAALHRAQASDGSAPARRNAFISLTDQFSIATIGALH